jgi:hypothetical protein
MHAVFLDPTPSVPHPLLRMSIGRRVPVSDGVVVVNRPM